MMLMIMLGAGIVFALSRNMELNENMVGLVLIVGASLWCVQNRASNDKMAESCFLVSIYFLSVMLSRVINNNVEKFNTPMDINTATCDELLIAKADMEANLLNPEIPDSAKAIIQERLDEVNAKIAEKNCSTGQAAPAAQTEAQLAAEGGLLEPWQIGLISSGSAIFVIVVVFGISKFIPKK